MSKTLITGIEPNTLLENGSTLFQDQQYHGTN
ncbi:carbohydrate porin [Klebsiella pneumoniae subsp. pneumoniae]|nr:carbohydrate porin [Klebsiella pneumoniae subsp. pneumoniae]